MCGSPSPSDILRVRSIHSLESITPAMGKISHTLSAMLNTGPAAECGTVYTCDASPTHPGPVHAPSRRSSGEDDVSSVDQRGNLGSHSHYLRDRQLSSLSVVYGYGAG